MKTPAEKRITGNFRIGNIEDGTMIVGDSAVQSYIDHERKLFAEHGAAIIFQVYRLDLLADTLVKLQGPRLAEIKVDSRFVSGADTVAAVKIKVRSLLTQLAGNSPNSQYANLQVFDPADQLTLYLNGHPLPDSSAFYADNHIILPVWIQVLLHPCDSEEATALIDKLKLKV